MAKTRARSPRAPSLAALANQEAPFDQMDLLVERLVLAPKESKHLEWKSHPPIGPRVSVRAKYRMVKSVLAFANWQGGFIIFGVEPDGHWKGLDRDELTSVDPAAISELINGCIFSEISDLNYSEFERDDKLYALLHVPPSSSAPHVTTKQLVEKDTATGKVHVIVQKFGLYCRQGAKSDLATPQQHHQLLARRTELLRDEMLRRVREVTISVGVSSKESAVHRGSIGVARLTNDPNAPAVRLTREEGVAGTLLHEELSDGLFEEINNVVDANSLLAGDSERFLLGEEVFYRVYAERQHVVQADEKLALLAATGLSAFYAPNLYWFARIEPTTAVRIMQRAASDMKMPQVRGLMRLTVILGEEAVDWLWKEMEAKYGKKTQPPDYFFAFKAMRCRTGVDFRYVALKSSGRTLVQLPDGGRVTCEALIAKPDRAGSLLTHACMAVFGGRKEFRQSARYLDVLAYGAELNARASAINAFLEQGG